MGQKWEGPEQHHSSGCAELDGDEKSLDRHRLVIQSSGFGEIVKSDMKAVTWKGDRLYD